MGFIDLLLRGDAEQDHFTRRRDDARVHAGCQRRGASEFYSEASNRMTLSLPEQLADKTVGFAESSRVHPGV